MTWILIAVPLRRTSSSIVSLGEYWTIRASSGCSWSIFVPLMATMMSPSWRSAFAAGLPGFTAGSVPPLFETSAPASTVRPRACLSCRSMGWYRNPIHGRASASPRSACSMIGRAMSIGIAKPMPLESVATAVFTPTTEPDASASGPPELPGLIAASVWIRLLIRVPFSTRMSRPLARRSRWLPRTSRCPTGCRWRPPAGRS